MCYLYILWSVPSGRYYIGTAADPDARLAQHNAGKTSSTRAYRPWLLVYTEAFKREAFKARSDAMKREREVKSWKSPRYMKRVLGLESGLHGRASR
jgi:putative endonuclease